jgi:hypothetical protein
LHTCGKLGGFLFIIIVTDKGNGGQPACPEEWKKCKEEHE